MTSDQLGWIAVLLLIVCVIAAVLEHTTLAWILAILAIGLIIYAKVKK